MKKAPGVDLITPKMLKELPQKGMVFLTYLFNAILRHHHWPHQLKLAEIILIPNPGKDPKDVKPYCPISLSPIIAKLLEKLILQRNDPAFTTSDWIPHHQFGFCRAHSTIQQCHSTTNTILKAINNKEYCTSVFLDVSQAFDKVWRPGIVYKIKNCLPTFFPFLKSYLSNRQFRTRVKGEVSALFPINSGVPQGSVLGPMLYLLFTSDLPQAPNVTIGTFADDTVILTCHTDVLRASFCLQEYLNIIQSWLHTWKIKINVSKSTYLTCTLRRDPSPPIYLNNVETPPAKTVKYP